MAYIKLNLENGQKLNATHLAHIESGIAMNEAELAKKAAKSDIPDISNLQPKGDYVLRNEIPDITLQELQNILNVIDYDLITLTEEEILNICKN